MQLNIKHRVLVENANGGVIGLGLDMSGQLPDESMVRCST